MDTPPRLVTLLRHGDIDAAERLVGQTDAALTATGRDAMAAAWTRIALTPVAVDAIASSDLRRCAEFARAQARTLALPLQLDAGWRETDFGTWEGRPLRELEQAHPGWQGAYTAGRLLPPGGEALPAFRARVEATTARWLAGLAGGHAVLVCHGGVIAALAAHWLALPLDAARRLFVARGGFMQLSLLAGQPAYLMRLENPCAA